MSDLLLEKERDAASAPFRIRPTHGEPSRSVDAFLKVHHAH
jgi:hypothetical protein